MIAAERALAAVWETIFPARCLGCGRRGEVLCLSCQPLVPRLPPGSCPRCALPGRRGAGSCPTCRYLPASLAAVRAACVYEGIARSAVQTLKFRSGRYLVPFMGGLLREAATRRPLAADLVVPVPLSRRRWRERGYNQAELLAGEVVSTVGGPLATDLLEREDRPAQRTLPASERRRNVVGAFRCVDPAAAAGRRILLVDDVATTCSTLAACADALATAGAVRIAALVFARDA